MAKRTPTTAQPDIADLLLYAAEAEECRRSFKAFAIKAWDILEPGTPLNLYQCEPALGAALCYNKPIKLLWLNSAGYTVKPVCNSPELVTEASYDGYSILKSSPLQISLCFPLDWRKAVMPLPKDPSKHEAWLKNQSEKHKNQPTSEKTRARRAEIMRERRQDPVYMQKLMDGIQNREMTDEYRQKLSDAGKEHGFSEAARQASIESRRENGVSEATRTKMSISHMGNTNGSKLSQASRDKRAVQLSANPLRKGHKMTEEERQRRAPVWEANGSKISATLKANWASLSEEERNARISYAIETISIKPSSLELLVSQVLDSIHIVYQPQYRVGRYITDFYIPSWNAILEVMGCYWHGCMECNYDYPEKREKDYVRNEFLAKRGYIVAHVWEHSIRKDIDEAVQTAIASIRARLN